MRPAISIEQKNTSKNPRSTVATVTEIYDYMRVLFARAGVPYSPFTGKPIVSQSVSEMVDKIKTLPKSSTIHILAPIVRGRKGEYKKEILNFKKRGFRKVKIDNVLYDIEQAPELNKKVKHDISVLVDRVILNTDLGNRLAESVETAVNLSNGLLNVEYENETLPKKYRKIEKIIFSSKISQIEPINIEVYFHKKCAYKRWGKLQTKKSGLIYDKKDTQTTTETDEVIPKITPKSSKSEPKDIPKTTRGTPRHHQDASNTKVTQGNPRPQYNSNATRCHFVDSTSSNVGGPRAGIIL